MGLNWRKQNAQDEHRMDRAFVVFLYIFGMAWLARAVVMLVNGGAIIGISQRYFQPRNCSAVPFVQALGFFPSASGL
ncbi:MAG: hypothetical protein WAU70_18130 [Flavobacteriales bacterium]